MIDLETNLIRVREQLQQACQGASRNVDQVTIMAVSKTRQASEVRSMANLGMRCFGENYVKEAIEKKQALTDLNIDWHFIGAIQSRKCADIAKHFSWVHSIDRFKVAKKISDHADTEIQVCIQVNIDNEPTKAGVMVESVAELVEEVSQLPHLNVRGIMVIPSPSHLEQTPNAFDRAAHLLTTLQAQFKDLSLDTLSMGMSGDMTEAVAAGSTCVRVGTALFGPRPPKQDNIA